MKISTFGYSKKQGVKNIGRNKMFSIASIATMSACIFLFGLFYSIVMNFNISYRRQKRELPLRYFLIKKQHRNKKITLELSLRMKTEY